MYKKLVCLISFVLVLGLAGSVSADPNLVGWWNLDESSGSTADDSSGYDNDGTVVGDVEWLPSGGQFDGAASFTGGSQRIEISTSDMSASAGTVALWGYPEGAQTQYYRYFFAIRDLPGGGNRVQLYLYQSTMQLGVGLGDAYNVNTNIMTLSTDTWYHIALTWDGGDYVVYVDGNSVDSGTYTGLSSMTTGGDIGNDHQGRNVALYGRIDDVGAWDGALGASDIEDIYLYGIGGTAPPGKATSPSPSHQATDVGINADLSWTAGSGATSHDVYFGTDSTPDETEFKGNQAGTTYEPGTLANDTTYYWRIDEKNAGGTTTGDVWSFTTEAEAAPPDPNLVGWWKLDESSGSTAGDSSGNGYNGTLINDVAWSPSGGQFDGAASFYNTSNTGDQIEFSTAGMSESAGTVALWARPETERYHFIFGTKNDAGNRIQLYISSGTLLDLGLGDSYQKDLDIASLPLNTWSHIALTWDGTNYIVYVDANSETSGTYSGLSSLSATANLGNNGDYHTADRTAAFDGRIDDAGIWDEVLDAGEIADIYNHGISGDPGIASNPSPADEATDVNVNADLIWEAGDYVADVNGHDVYLGTNYDSVADANHSSAEFKGTMDTNSYDPTLSGSTTYYWAIDEVNDTHPDSPWLGCVWSFTTAAAGGGAPGKATNPSPADDATGVDTNADLGWTAGPNATSHDVYFGTDSTPDETEFKGNQAGTTYEPGTMDANTTYYWRIDEKNQYGTTTGDVWNFTTAGGGTGSGATPVAEFRVIPTSGWDIYYRPEFVSKATGDITSYEWDFGDGQTSSDRAPNHQYSSSGTYTIELTVSGPGGSDSETKTNHITVNDFDDYPYDDYVLTQATQTQWWDALDDIETAGGGRILFDFSNQTIYVNDRYDFFGDNCIVDGQDKNVKFYYNGPDTCDQTEGQDTLIRFHGDDNIFRNVDYDRFPDGVHIRDGNRNLIENVTVNTICEDAMSMNGGGYECFDCIIRNCTFGESEDKAVMVNNGGRAVFRNLDFTDSTQPIRCGGSTGEYVIRHCDFDGTLNSSSGPRHSGGSPGHLVYFEENNVHNSQRGIRVYGYVDAIIRHNTFSTGSRFGVYVYENAKARLEHNTITNYDLDGVSVDNSALADLGGGSVSIDGSSAASPGGNTITGNSSYDVQNNTGSGIKAEYNYWDHSTVSDVEQYDVDGTVDVDPLGS